MSWGIWKIADWIQSLRTPNWIKAILSEIQQIIVSSLVGIGKEYLRNLSDKICEVASSDMSSEKKFMVVFQWGKANIPNIKDASLNLIIEILVNTLKQKGFAKVS